MGNFLGRVTTLTTQGFIRVGRVLERLSPRGSCWLAAPASVVILREVAGDWRALCSPELQVCW